MAVTLLLAASTVHAQDPTLPSRDELQKSLRTTCELRMRELERQGQQHLAAIKWEVDDTGAHGAYVGYSPDYICAVSPVSGDAAVGRMRYQEIHFEKRGADVSAAMESSPSPVRIEEVTQVFIYRHGLWQ